jgi:hypothetical protein
VSAREVWTYFLSRDSLQGELSGKVHLWYRKPMRTKHSYRVSWLCADHRDPGYLGAFGTDEIEMWFGRERIPETDLQLIRIEQYASEKMKAEAAKQ